MNKKKLIYAQPDCDLFVVRFEGGFLTGSPDGTWDKSIQSGSQWGGNNGEDYGLE